MTTNAPPMHPRTPARFRRDSKGVTAVEFGLVAPALVLMIMGVVEIGLTMAAQAILDNAAFSASRVGKTGYVEAKKTQAETVTAAVQKAASKYLDPAKITVTSLTYTDYANVGQPEPFTDLDKNGQRGPLEPFTDVNGNGSYDLDQGKTGLGAAAQIVVYTATYNWTLHTPLMSGLIGKDGIVPLKSRIVVKNEPYS